VAKVYFSFEEIEADVARNAPDYVYKYRSWKDANHKNVLLLRQLYFSHPFDLNDPLDVRPDARFDYTEIEDQMYFYKLLASAAVMNPELPANELRSAAEKQWKLTKEHPQILNEQYRIWMSKRRNFDLYGILSTSTDPVNEKLWERYGDEHAGYCLGFKTVDLCRQLKTGFGLVKYSEAPFEFSILGERDDLEPFYLKKPFWGYESEFRFYTLGIGFYSKRVREFPIVVVSEIILGYKITPEHQKEILLATDEKYPKEQILVYKTKVIENNNLIKERIR